MKSFSKTVSRWAMQCVANPSFIITTSGECLVLYDLKKKKVVEHEHYRDLELKSERGNED